MKPLMKPLIICLSEDTDDTFEWQSESWFSAERRHEPFAKTLRAKAEACIKEASDVRDAIKRLRLAGFDVIRNDTLA